MQKQISRKGMYLVAVTLCLAGSAISQEPLPPVYRLPTTIIPVRYLLQLEPNMTAKTVSGAVTIEIITSTNQSEPLNSVTLHLGVDVTVDDMMVKLLDSSGVTVPYGAIEYDDANTLIKVMLPEGNTLQPNEKYMITFYFSSLLYSEPNGLFIGQYNATSNYVASYFRPTFARNLFPCFDEPSFKTPITLQVMMPDSYTAVCTGAWINRTNPDANGMVIERFEINEAISLHSLGLFISPISPVPAMGLNLFVPSGIPTTVDYLNTILQNLQNTVGKLPTPGGTFNLVVLPDRIFTSLSSYGIVYTSPDVYLGNELGWRKQFSNRVKMTLAFLTQYLEYQMTPEWWSDIWLSDSVGTFVALMLQPEYSETKFSSWIKVEMRSNGFGLDFNDCSRPVIDNQLLSRWDILDAIVSESIKYKGLNVLTMWNDVMPEGLVMNTIQEYVKLKNPSVTTDNFLELMVNNIRANTTYNVTSAADLLLFWLNTTGNPVLNYLPYNSSMFYLTQSASCPTANGSIWPISVSYTQNHDQDWTYYRQGIWQLGTLLSISQLMDKWIIFNLETAPYRVNYENSWDQIIEALKTDLAPSTDTPDTVLAMVQEDATALALAGGLPFPTMLSVLTHTRRNQADWISLANIFNAITAKIGDNHFGQETFGVYVASLFSEELLNAFDLWNDSTDTSVEFVRAVMIPWLCEFDIGTCRQATVQLFQNILQGNMTGINSEEIDNVACQGARYNASVISQLVTAYQNTSDPWQRYLYTLSLGCTRDPTSVETLLNTIVNPSSPFFVDDARTIMIGLASCWQNSAQIVNFIVAQSAVIQQTLGIGALSRTIQSLAKFNVDLSNLWHLTNSTLALDLSVVQTVFWSLAAENESSIWWQNYGAVLEAALSASTPPSFTTMAPPSSASSLVDFQAIGLVVTTVLMVFTVKFY